MSYLKTEDNDLAENKVFFWHGLLDPNGLGEDYQTVIEKINEGNYQGLDLEKLIGHNVYSARIDGSARMLFTTIYVNDEPYLLLLDVVLNHDYHKSRFLKPAVLKHYMELNGKAFAEEITKAQFEKAANPPPAPAANRKQPTQYSKVEFFNQKYFEFDTTQQGALVKAQKTLPLVIEGVAGSGKSCLAVSLFTQHIETEVEKKFPILYVTESEELATHLREIWHALPNAQGLDPNDVQFKSYEQLIKELDPEAAKKTFVGKESCYTWITNHFKNYKKNKKAQKDFPLENSFNSNPEALYQEFRIISGCRSFDEYKERGRKQSLYPNEKEKKWIYNAYLSYQKEKTIHAPFYPLKLDNKFKLVVVDEAQDLSHLQLETLSRLACDNQICFCQDKRQSLADVKSKLPFLKTLMYQSDETFNHVNLPFSRRCKEAIIAMANALSSVKARVTGQFEEELLAVPAGPDKGSVKWLDKESELSALRDLVSDAELAPDFAVITSKKFKAEAEKLFPKNDVYTPEEIKGREYKSILSYRLFDENPSFKEAEQLLKKGEVNEQFATLFSPVFTAFTRPTDNLYIYQEENYQLQTIIQTLKSALPKEQNEALKELPKLSAEAINEKWFSRVKEHLSNGEIKKARKIYVETLKKTPEEFEELKKLFCAPAPVKPTTNQPKPPTANNNSPKTNSNNNTNSGQNTSQKSNQKTTKSTNQRPNNNSTFFPQNPVEKKDKKTEQDNYVKGLAEAPTPVNFATLLKLKRPKYYMFHHPLEDGTCLFTSLFYKEETREQLFELIKDPLYEEIFKGITQEALCRPLESPYASLVKPESSSDLDHSIYNLAIGKANAQAARDYVNTSPLYWFMASEKGLRAFGHILTRNTSLAQEVTAEALCRTRPAQAKHYANFSPLSVLSNQYLGQSTFRLLMLYNPKIAQGITAEALCLPLTSEAGTNAHMTALFCFSLTDPGKEVLKLLFTKNPKLAGEIEGKALCIKYTSGINKDVTPFAALSKSVEGIEILQMLLDANPELVKTISGDVFCFVTNNSSPLYNLSTEQKGLDLLSNILQLNLSLAFEFSAETLCLAQDASAGEHANASALYWLSSTAHGRSILTFLLMTNQALGKGITVEALTRKLPATAGEGHASQSPLTWLSKSDEGLDLINLIRDQNPEVEEFVKQFDLGFDESVEEEVKLGLGSICL